MDYEELLREVLKPEDHDVVLVIWLLSGLAVLLMLYFWGG